MRKVLLLLFSIVVIEIHSLGGRDNLIDVNDIEVDKIINTINVRKGVGGVFAINLSYSIPINVSQLYDVDVQGINIMNIWIDGKRLNSKFDRWADISDAHVLGTKPKMNNQEEGFITLRFLFDAKNEHLNYYEWYKLEDKHPSRYVIKRGTKEVVLEYKVGFPYGGESESKTVKFNLTWD